MPKSSGNTPSDSQPTKLLPENASIENLRKQAKTLLKGVRANDPDALTRVRVFHPRFDSVAEFSLSDAQLVIARTYSFASWSKLKQHVEVLREYSALPADLNAADTAPSPVDRFIGLACLNYSNDHVSKRDQARELLAANPSLSKENIYAAATVGDVSVVETILDRDPALAKQRGGPHNWEPLLYATYSRLNSELSQHSTLEVARLLLKHGADPNAGFLWGRNYLFTALTGAFGEGERGPTHQPEHQFCYSIARLLLESGTDPNDGQTLYNRMFTGGIGHLELLFEFGLGKGGDGVWFKRLGGSVDSPEELLQQQVAWAAKYNQMARMKLLVAHGVDLNRTDSRFARPPHQLALLNGNAEMANYLLSVGATRASLSDLDAFSAACMDANGVEARRLLEKDSTLLKQLGTERAELLNHAAESGKREAVQVMAELGFDLNERKRTTPIHLAAAGGHFDMVKLLIELGADPMVRDEEFNGTALGWADYSGQTEVSEFLRALGCTY